MPASQASAEEAVVAAALSRGFVTAAQVEKARRDVEEFGRRGQKVELLAVVSARHLAPPQRDELRKVYQDALAQSRPPSAPAPAPGDEESTQLLDRPVLPPGAAPPAGGDAGATLAAPPGMAQAFGASPGPPGKATQADLVVPAAPGSAAAVGMDRTVAQGPPTGDLATPPRADGKGKGPPKRIGNYDIVRELGRGGMGVVYDARHVTLDRRVALKVLLAGTEATGEDVLRFQVEAKAAARLDHPNVVRVHEQGQDQDGHWFMAMDLVDGESLVARLEREGALDPREAAGVIRDVARAVAYAHGQSVLHRDLKPHNVLLDRAGTPKLTDFGLAKLVGDQRGKSITRTGSGILGSPAYMSPEQAGDDAKRVDVRCDVYGLGATLYHAITGKMPFDGDTLARVVVAVLQKPPVPPSKVNRKVPKDLETICLKCLEKEPKHRYQSAAEVVTDLDRFLEDQEISARPPGALVRGGRWAARNQRTVAAGVTLLLLLVAGVAYEARSRATASADEAAKTAAAKKLADDEARKAADAQAREEAAKKKAADAEIRQRLAEETARREREEREREDKKRAEKEAQRLEREKRDRERADQAVKDEQARKAREEKEARDLLAAAGAAVNSPPSNTTSPPPSNTATPPPANTATPPPANTEPPPPPPPSSAPLPEWTKRLATPRGIVIPGGPRLLVGCDVPGAFAEAASRQCPVVLVILDSEVRALPEPITRAAAWLNAHAVVVLLQDNTLSSKSTAHKKEGPCPYWPELTCGEHDAAWKYADADAKDKIGKFWADEEGESKQRPRIKGEEQWVVSLRLPDKRALGFATSRGVQDEHHKSEGPLLPAAELGAALEGSLARLPGHVTLTDPLAAAAEAIAAAMAATADPAPTGASKQPPYAAAVAALHERAREEGPWAAWARHAVDGIVERLRTDLATRRLRSGDIERLVKVKEVKARVLAKDR